MTRDEIFHKLAELKVWAAEIEYSGGDDEDGLQGIFLVPVQGHTGRYLDDYEDKELHEALCAPIWDGDWFTDAVETGSGDRATFNGTLRWNVSDKTVVLSCSYMTQQSTSSRV